MAAVVSSWIRRSRTYARLSNGFSTCLPLPLRLAWSRLPASSRKRSRDSSTPNLVTDYLYTLNFDEPGYPARTESVTRCYRQRCGAARFRSTLMSLAADQSTNSELTQQAEMHTCPRAVGARLAAIGL